MLKTYDLATLNARAKNDPKGFIEESEAAYLKPVSYTHLTLPTILLV